ncbi:MAG: M23 family metallopeptidase, partial [Phormidesmis sp.]
MSYREDVRAAIAASEGGSTFLAKVDSSASISGAEVDRYFPAEVQDRLFRGDQERLINHAMDEGCKGDRLIERVGQLHYAGLDAPVDGTGSDKHGRLSIKAYGEELSAAYEQKVEGGESVCKATGTYINPLKNGAKPGSRRFGEQFHPIENRWKMHAGDDIPAAEGTEVVAADGGVVTYAQVSGSMTSGYGQLIIVDHGDGRESYYAHLSGYAVKEGDRVAQGQVIGYVGSTGGSTGPHLHYENRINGQPVDPSGGTNYNTLEPQTKSTSEEHGNHDH